LKALTQGATIFEVSTKHYEEDSYRVFPGSFTTMKIGLCGTMSVGKTTLVNALKRTTRVQRLYV
jgi:GTPase SAR1 family protein